MKLSCDPIFFRSVILIHVILFYENKSLYYVFSYDLFLFRQSIQPNTVWNRLVKSEKDIYWPVSYSQTSTRTFPSRMTFLLWIVTGHVPSITFLGYAKTADI